jgi:hypothetical protein
MAGDAIADRELMYGVERSSVSAEGFHSPTAVAIRATVVTLWSSATTKERAADATRSGHATEGCRRSCASWGVRVAKNAPAAIPTAMKLTIELAQGGAKQPESSATE